MRSYSFTRVVNAIADALEFNEAVRNTNVQSLAGKAHMVQGQFKNLRERIVRSAKLHSEQLLELPYEEAHREVARRKRDRKIAIDRKKARNLENKLLWGE